MKKVTLMIFAVAVNVLLAMYTLSYGCECFDKGPDRGPARFRTGPCMAPTTITVNAAYKSHSGQYEGKSTGATCRQKCGNG